MPLRTSLHRKPGRWSSRNSKRRELLSVNMISLPLGDFRHVSHIGRDANNSFGDLSFLKMGQNLFRQSSQSEQNLILACSPPPKPPRLNLDSTEGSLSSGWSVDQEKKKCSSLPLLDIEEEEVYQRRNNVTARHTDRSGCGSLSSDMGEESTESCDKTIEQKDEDSSFSFSLDLGPSILDDVLQVMDKLHN